MSDTKTIAEKLTQEFKEYREINEQRIKAVESNNDARAKELDAQLSKSEESLHKLEKEFETMQAKMATVQPDVKEKENDIYEKSFEALIRKGANASAEERKGLVDYAQKVYGKALSTDSLPDSGLFTINSFDTEVIRLIRETSPMRQVCRVKSISTGDSWTGSRKKTNSGAEWTGERTAPSDTTTPTWEALRIQTHELAAAPRISQQSLEDSIVDVRADLASDLAETFAITENSAFMNGDGIDKPQGVLSSSDILSTINGSDTVISADKMIEMRYQLKTFYGNRATWLLNRLSVAEVRKLKVSGSDNYLWQPGLSELTPANILGRPYLMADDLVAPVAGVFTSGDKPVLFGDFQSAYYIVDRIGMQMTVDIYTAKPYVEYYTRKRVGGGVVKGEAITALSMTTS